MLDPSNRFATIVLAVGTVVLLVAIVIGERMGDRVLGQAAQQGLDAATAGLPTPAASATPGPYGPDWKRSNTLSSAPDPHFPDPRVPPQPLPTPLPTPKVTPTPFVPQTPTPNPNIPIWRQQPLPTATPLPSALPSPGSTAEPSRSPEVQPPADARRLRSLIG